MASIHPAPDLFSLRHDGEGGLDVLVKKGDLTLIKPLTPEEGFRLAQLLMGWLADRVPK